MALISKTVRALCGYDATGSRWEPDQRVGHSDGWRRRRWRRCQGGVSMARLTEQRCEVDAGKVFGAREGNTYETR